MSEVEEVVAKLNHERSEASKIILDKNGGQQMQVPYVIFMTPSIDHMVTLGFLKSFYESAIALANAGIPCGFQSFGGDPYLAKVRNLLVSSCLKRYPDATDFFFLDADLEWDAAAVLRMVKRPEAIVAGVYPKKNDRLEYPAAIRMDETTQKPIDNDGLVQAEMVPTGFLRVKRHVYEKMASGSPRYKDGTGGGEECWNIFEMGFDKTKLEETGFGDWWGEDFAWCRRALNMGYDIWVDPDIQFGHRGAKTWRNNFNDAVQAVRDGTAKLMEAPAAGSPVAAAEPAAAEGASPEAAALAPLPVELVGEMGRVIPMAAD